jgi:tRNA (mo5U34)-methyltransferase
MKLLAGLEDALARAPLGGAVAPMGEALRRCLEGLRHGDAGDWEEALAALPALRPTQVDLKGAAVRIGSAAQIDAETRARLHEALQQLHPWRKGPFSLFGVEIDSEWRSDRKWARIAPHLDLRGRHVLDVGCGNGYYAWRMLGAGADWVLGIDPTLRFLAQFRAVQHYLDDPRVLLLPLRAEDLPPRLGCFDTVFSMGVLYHRRSPFEHLAELLDALRPGGELVLETLVVQGDADRVLVPSERYAMMRNVWFIPSPPAMLGWLRRAGFRDARLADLCATTTGEQRRTTWMRFESLADFLDPVDPRRTREGYPAPLRAVFIASRPR